MTARVAILGGGPAGIAAAHRLAGRPGLETVLVDSHGRSLLQAGLLGLALDGVAPAERDLRELLPAGVTLRVGRARSIDPARRVVELEDGRIEFDGLILATGSRVYDGGIPGFRDLADHFHCTPAAERLRDRLREFRGGRVVIGAASLPYKCPPVVPEFALRLEERLRARGLRDRSELTYVYPAAGVLHHPDLSSQIRPWLEAAGCRVVTSFAAASIRDGSLNAADGRSLPFDLLVMVPPHVAAPYLRNSPLAGPSGFVDADPETLRVRDRIYAAGDTAALPAPKTAVAAQASGAAAADNLAAELEGKAPPARYDGSVECFMETGGGMGVRIAYSYDAPPAPLERRPEWAEAKRSLLHEWTR